MFSICKWYDLYSLPGSKEKSFLPFVLRAVISSLGELSGSCENLVIILEVFGVNSAASEMQEALRYRPRSLPSVSLTVNVTGSPCQLCGDEPLLFSKHFMIGCYCKNVSAWDID